MKQLRRLLKRRSKKLEKSKRQQNPFHEPKQILVPPEVAKVIMYFLKAVVIQNKKICESKVTFAS